MNVTPTKLYYYKNILMKTYLVPLFLLLLLPAHAEESDSKQVCEICWQRTDHVEAFDANAAEYVMEFQNLSPQEMSTQILYSIDGQQHNVKLKNGVFRVQTTPGKHIFQIWLSYQYNEIYSDTLEIGSKERQTFHLFPSKARIGIMVDKPVIYLYPQTTQEFTVEVKPKGEFTFVYPEYNNGWKGTMHPDGSLDINEERYRYLFWESKQQSAPIVAQETEGFVVEGTEITAFLESTLTAVGFTAVERADFITFWAPRMMHEKKVFVHFHQNADCDQFAALNITPEPDQVHRFYMSWGQFEGDFTPAPQDLAPFAREGFTVVEWGGQETVIINQNEL